jgi:hypothetical protein
MSCVAEVVTQQPCASEWQDEWEYAVTICFTNPTDSLQSRVRRFDSDPASKIKLTCPSFRPAQAIASGATVSCVSCYGR